MKWLQVELRLKPELAEPVAELLARYANDGVAVTSYPPDESIYETGEVRVFGYLPAGPDLESQQKALEEDLWHLGQIQPLPEPLFEWVEDIYWALSWRFHYHPLEVGQRFMIQPAWIEPEPSDRLTLRMNPGMAFGTGTHPSTQLTLELIEAYFQPGQTLVDLGSGSGILSIAGALLGAKRVLALDTSEEAVLAGRRNSALNHVGAQIDFRQGSLKELLAAVEDGLAPDLIAVNILAGVIEGLLAAGLTRALAPTGNLILAGILEDQSDSVLAAARKQGLHLVEERSREDWRAFLLNQNPPR